MSGTVQKQKVVLGLYGAGDFAREVMPLVREYVSGIQKTNPHFLPQVYFIETTPQKSQLGGVLLISEDQFFALECSERLFNVAVGNSADRERIAEKCIQRGAKPFALQAAQAITYDNNDIAEGAIICAHAMVTSNTRIGRFFHANIYSYVAHDCVIGDFVTFAPRVSCNGNVHIHNHVYIGAGAMIKPGTPKKPLVIGEGARIGMGTVITKSVPPYATVLSDSRVFTFKK